MNPAIAELPDVAPPHHPPPWEWVPMGNGKGWIVDANGGDVVSLYLWDREEIEQLHAKLATINGAKP